MHIDSERSATEANERYAEFLSRKTVSILNGLNAAR